MTGEKTWLSMPFSRDDTLKNTTPCRLEGLWFEFPGVVFERGNPGSWDEFGVRDPALLVDSRGYLLREGGALVLYYTGSHDGGRWQGTGRAISFDEGCSWLRSPESPVLAPRKDGWDRAITSTPWVLRDDDGLYRLYYRGARAVSKDEAIGLAISEDGVNFERVGSQPILKAGDFVDMPQDAPLYMGVVNVARTPEGRYLLTFEGSSVSHGRTAQIFGAISDDGMHFRPLNGGRPIFTAGHVRSWPVRRVANPRITVLEDSGLYLLSFNAHGNTGLYALALAFSRDLEEWWEHPGNPLISPSGVPVDYPFSGRIEGGVIVKDDLERETGPIRLFLMAIPGRGPSHKGGVIGLAQGWIGGLRGRYAFHAVSAQPGDIMLAPPRDGEAETLYLRQSSASAFPPGAHFLTFNRGAVQALALEIFLEPAERGWAFLALSAELGTVFGIEGVRLGFSRGRLYSHHISRFLRSRKLARWLGPWIGWRKLGACEQGVWHSLHLERKGERWIVELDGRHLASIPEAHPGAADIYDIAMQSAGQPVRIRNLKTLVSPDIQRNG